MLRGGMVRGPCWPWAPVPVTRTSTGNIRPSLGSAWGHSAAAGFAGGPGGPGATGMRVGNVQVRASPRRTILAAACY